MPEIGNKNIIQARLDPERLKLFERLRRKKEKDGDIIRRAIDALCEKEGVKI